MNDMIGCAGMLQGWTTLWQTELMWLLPTLVVAVGVVALMESVIRSRTLLPSLSRILHMGLQAGPALAVGLVSVKPVGTGSGAASSPDLRH
jgi:hypothetical protein